MITEAYFEELVRDLFSEYLPKVKSQERKEFTAALLDELKAQDIEFEEPVEADPYDDMDRRELSQDYSQDFSDD